MKFLFIAPIPFFHERGACIRSLNLIEALSSKGHEIDVVTYPVGRDLKIKGVKIIRVTTRFKPPLKATMTFKRLLTDYLLYKKARDLVKKNHYDCLIGKTPIGRIIGRKIKSKTKIPLIVDVVESTLGMVELYSKKGSFGGKPISKIIKLFLNPLTVQFLKNLESKNYRSADVILANWDLVQEDIEKESHRKPILLYDTIPDMIRTKGKDIRKELGIKNEKVLLYTGASSPQQGIDIYIRSMTLLKHKNVKLIIVGPKNKKYVTMAQHEGVSNAVIFTGQVGFEELPNYFKTADILLTAYDTGGKNATVKLLFYMFQEKPIVASNTQQYRQIVNNDVVFLAEPTAEDFARTIDHILDHPKEAAMKAKKSVQYANKKFSKEAYMKNLKNILSAI